MRDLNFLYRETPALHQLDCDPEGFQWIDAANAAESIVSYLRRSRDPHRAQRRRLQLHPDAARELPHWGAAAWALSRAHQYRRNRIWRQRGRQCRRGACRAPADAWPRITLSA